MNINEQAQANALDDLFATFWKEPWWEVFCGNGFQKDKGMKAIFQKIIPLKAKRQKQYLKSGTVNEHCTIALYDLLILKSNFVIFLNHSFSSSTL